MPILVIIAILLLVHFFVIDLGEALKSLTQELPPYGILLVFFLSESLLGLIPPEIFIAWANTTLHPNGNLALLATLSYMGGILSYFIGKAITDIPAVHNYLEVKMAKHLKNTAKWGGFLIVAGALLPIPFSITCVAAGIIGYPLRGVFLFGLLRFLRFFLYALAIFNIF